MAQITLTNLVVNGDFEQAITLGTTAGSNQWSSNFASNPTVQPNPVPPHDEGGNFALQNTGSVNGPAYAQLSSNINVVAGRKYYMRCLTRFEGTKYAYTIQFYNGATALANGIAAYIIGGGLEGVRNTYFMYDGGAAVGAQSAGGIWTAPANVANFPLRLNWSGGQGNQLRHNYADNLMMIDVTELSQAPYNLNDATLLAYARIIYDIHGFWNGSKVVNIPDGPLAINQLQTLANGRRGQSYSETVDVSGGWQPYTFAIQSGNLPQGLSLNTSTGAITGTVSNVIGNYGAFNFTVQVTDGINTLVTKAYSLFVDASPMIITTLLSNVVTDEPYSFQVSADGTNTSPNTIQWSLIDGAFPSGISINSNGLISGTTSVTSGSFSVTLKADNGIGTPATIEFTFLVSSAASISTTSFPNATSGVYYDQEIIVSGVEPITVEQTGGDLSIIGISVVYDNGKWYLRGTPIVPNHDNYLFTLTATNELGSDSRNFDLTIGVKPAISTATLPNAIQGNAYSTTLQGTGSTPFTYRLVSGTFPTGIVLNPNGTISGTTSQIGTFSNLVIEIINDYGTSQRTFSLTVIQPTENATITTNIIPNGTVGAAFSFQVVATGFPVPTFGTVVPNLPPGLSINSAGLITGTPNTQGSFTFSLTATNTGGTDTRSYTVIIGNPPSITAISPIQGIEGTALTRVISATGYPTPTWSATGIPSGMTLNANNGTLIWNNPVAGTYTINVTVTNQSGTDSKQFVINIMLPPRITTTSLPEGVLNQVYPNTTLAASGDGTKTWSLIDSVLPNGMSLSSSGVISGTPTQYGSFDIFVQVDTPYGFNARMFTLVIAGPPIITSPTNLPDAGDGAPYNYTLQAEGTPPITFGLASGSSLPPWLSLHPLTGVLSAASPIVGIYNFSLTATNNIGTSTKAFTLEVKTPSIITESLLYSKLNVPFSVTFQGGGTPPFTFTWLSGNVPSGLSWDGVDTLSGTTDTAGIYDFTIEVQNPLSTNTKNFRLYVGDFPVITTESLAIGEVGVFFTDTLTTSGTAPVSLVLTSGSVPGLSFNPATKIISGTPTTSALYTLTFTATNILGSVTKTFSLLVTEPSAVPPAEITNTTLMDGIVGVPYSDFVLATGDNLEWALFSGTMPTGLSINIYTGEIYGTPQRGGGLFTFAIICFNPGGFDIQTYTIFIATPPLIVTHSLPDGIVGESYYAKISAAGDTTITFSVVTPENDETGLHPDLSFNSSTGEITGTPTSIGIWKFRIKAANSAGSNIVAYTLTIVKKEHNFVFLDGQRVGMYMDGKIDMAAMKGFIVYKV